MEIDGLRKSKRDLQEKFDLKTTRHSNLVRTHNEVVRYSNELLRRHKVLQDELADFKHYNGKVRHEKPKGSIDVNAFDDKEIKRILFALHPDKNGGKTHDIWTKLNSQVNK